MQALEAKIAAVQVCAAKIIKNESTAAVEDRDGVLQPVEDGGGRDALKSLVVDVQDVCANMDDRAKAELEQACAGAECTRKLNPQALAIPTQAPLDSYDARTWPAAFVQFWFGDGAPNLDRDRPMLFEEVARMLMNREELMYSLSSDSESQPYRASGQSRFNTPELVAVMGDVIRRLKLLKGTRASVQRSGFDSDVKALASASLDDFMTATNIAKPNESITTAASRSDMPAKVKTALRTLLLSTSDVPGTEGRKTQLRYNGHANNVFFGAPSFFTTPNFADTYNPLVTCLPPEPLRGFWTLHCFGESRRSKQGELA